MKSASGSRETPTPAERLRELLHLQHEALLRVIQRDTKRAPCRNRTYNLMIKSQLRRLGLARTATAQPFPAPSNVVALVPDVPPNRARKFHDNSHGTGRVGSVDSCAPGAQVVGRDPHAYPEQRGAFTPPDLYANDRILLVWKLGA